MVILSGYLGSSEHYTAGVRAAIATAHDTALMDPVAIVRGSISPTQAAALLFLKTFGYSPGLDFDRFARDPAAIGLSRSG